MEQPTRHVVIAGATGMVGREAAKILASTPGVRATALVRKAGAGLPSGVHEHVFDYESPASFEALGASLPCDVLLCCLGTTRAKAGSDDAFRRVDRDYPLALLEQLKKLPHRPVFALVSSIGADRPSGLYLETKAEVERALLKSGLPHVITRPSLLVGNREESRPGERVALALGKPLFGLLRVVAPVEAIHRYAPVEASQVAASLVRHALGPSPATILSGSQITA